MKGATSLSFLSLYYLGKTLYYESNKKLLSYLNNMVALSVLNMLSAVPFFALKWVLGLQSPPVFYPLQYTPEKINFKVDGVLGSVKKTLKNGVNRVKSYVMAYKTVMLQTTFLLAPKILTDSASLFTFRNTFFLNFLQTMEPVLTSLIYYFFDDLKLDTKTYLSLLPLVTGAAYATYSGVRSSFGVIAYFLLTNLGVYFTTDEMKEFLSQNMDKVGKNLTKSNLNSTVTISLYLLLSFVLVSEGCGFSYACDNLLKRIKGGDYEIIKYIFLSGLSNYMMNTARFGLFSELSPITKSVATTMLNLFNSLVVSVVSEGKLSKNELYGTALAIAGTFLYLLTK
ncbi:sugar transporter, putative [Theileria annulata]|uniref:Sugar transporter, putative n=1 Tax=Theileria annulata TaxID=5874 RepID=Q4UHQ1_THEAN|nr:sugar transporter, putative [Theileria annulata]CAI73388.1 sugar transporter, putative [Theileria annulata]|eukprot:XP_954065.1 sugar transporter, putative [Theileria annulata]